MTFLAEVVAQPRHRAWKVLFVCSTIYLLGALVFVPVSLAGLDSDQGHAAGFAAMALLAMLGVAVVAYLIALAAVVLLRRDIARPVVGALLLIGGVAVYVLSGGFVGFLPLAVLGIVVGGLAIFESMR